MAGKRQATYELNHDNWDREEEPEERGSFRTATEEELKNRVIKKAKRKIVSANDTANGEVGTKSVFSGFSGFGKPTAAVATSSSPFSFLSKIPAVAGTAGGVVSSSTTTTSATPTFSFGGGSMAAATPANTSDIKKSFSFVASVDAAKAVKASTSTIESSIFSEYHNKLSSLNQSVCDWIKTHVDKNPVCILSPIFKDYEKYLEEIEKEKNVESKKDAVSATKDKAEKPISTSGMGSFKFNANNSSDVSTKNAGSSSTTSEPATKVNGFTFDIKKNQASSVNQSTSQGFSFGFLPSATLSTTAVSSSLSFGSTSNNSQLTTPTTFSFNASDTPFSFGNVKTPDVSATNNSGCDPDAEDEEPPKNEFKQVVESDAVYSKKCKVFVKKDGNFVDKGVGTLYMKPIESSGKTQLLVRADTNLGNILVNLILSSAIPAQRMGKNNVMMVCLPTPDVDKTTTMLLRVKTTEEADELLETIDKYKK